MTKIFFFFKKRTKLLLRSFLTSLMLLVLCYYVTNIGFSIADEGAWVTNTNNNIKKFIDSKQPVIPDSVMLVNISYDKELIPYNDADGFPLGQIDITDRNALYRFLKILKERDDYKYIMLDVFFEDGFDSPNDEDLFPLIAEMRDIVISNHRDATIGHKEEIGKKAFISDYTVTSKSKSFMKYELMPDDTLTSAILHMYNEVAGRNIEKEGMLYTDSSQLCTSTLFAKQIINFSSPYDEEGNKNYYNLTEDLLMDEDELLTTNLLKNKYIFIGSMEINDIHGTTAGQLPGVVISANTFLSVMQGQHIIPLVVIIVLFIVLFIISYQIFSGKTIANFIQEKIAKYNLSINPVILSYFLSWVSYLSLLMVVCSVSYLFYGVVYDVFFTATIFQQIDYIITNWNKIKNAKKQTVKQLLISLIFKK